MVGFSDVLDPKWSNAQTLIATPSAWPRIATMTSWILADSHVEAYTKWRLIAIMVLLAGVIVFGISRRKPAARIVVTPVFSFS